MSNSDEPGVLIAKKLVAQAVTLANGDLHRAGAGLVTAIGIMTATIIKSSSVTPTTERIDHTLAGYDMAFRGVLSTYGLEVTNAPDLEDFAASLNESDRLFKGS